MMIFGLLLVCATGAFTGLLIADNLGGGPDYTVTILGNSLGTLAVVAVAIATFRARPLGNALILAGIAVAALGSGLAGLGIGALAPAITLAALLLFAGFVAPSLPKPHGQEESSDGDRQRRLGDRARNPTVRH